MRKPLRAGALITGWRPLAMERESEPSLININLIMSIKQQFCESECVKFLDFYDHLIGVKTYSMRHILTLHFEMKMYMPGTHLTTS